MNTGISFELVIPKEEVEGDAKENVKSLYEELTIAKNNNVKSILIPEVVREKKMKFFREPRLGCYLILDMTYKSSFSKKVFFNLSY